ncbi:Gfo/Idh/MocA family protein [Alienimonas californiensis]|nr:Gfo/Idh/MocA family oxidoreductase [Alienimonas californiensis]
MPRHESRRTVLKSLAAIGAGLYVGPVARADDSKSPNEKLNLGLVGVGGRGYANLQGVASQNLVALCDVDPRQAKTAFEALPQSTKYADFRRMLDGETLDGVVVSTTDHLHVPIALNAMRRGLPVYVEKPLGHNVWETRLAAQVAREQQVATQLGTQIHAGDNYRRVVELVRAGAIGPIEEVHVWVGKGWGGGTRPTDTPPTPEGLDWDLWLGPAPQRSYHPTYLPANWRRWWDFGSGTLGDMGCHYLDLVFWSLGLKYPTAVAAAGPPPDAETAPVGMTATWDFPARTVEPAADGAAGGEMPAVKVTWYDGDRAPRELHGIKLSGSGVLFVGKEGQLLADYGSRKLFPQEAFADFTPPEPSIPASIGHHAEWIRAVKTGDPTTCDFAYSGPLTETVLLGLVAYRLGRPIAWDAETLTVPDVPEAAALIRPPYRAGWEIA